jgi:hypothetical protein
MDLMGIIGAWGSSSGNGSGSKNPLWWLEIIIQFVLLLDTLSERLEFQGLVHPT